MRLSKIIWWNTNSSYNFGTAPWKYWKHCIKGGILWLEVDTLAHIFDIWNPLKSAEKSFFFAKNRFNSKFQIKMFGVRAFSIKRAFLSNFSQKFSPKFRSVWPYRQSLTHPYPLISIKISHFYQTFRKNFHQNFGVCGLIGSNWRTQIEGCVAL